VAVVATVRVDVDARDAAKQLGEVDRASKQLNDSVKTGGTGIDGFGGKLAIFAAKLFTVKKAVDIVKGGITTAFDLGAAEQRLKNLTGSTDEYNAALGVAKKASNDFGISQLQATKQLGEVYARISGLGYGLKEVGQIYRGFDAIVVESGATSEQAASAFMQLSQALGRGKLQGEDFRSVAGQMPAILDRLADAAGVSRGELQQMATEGKITGDIIYTALSTAAEGFDGLGKRLNQQQLAMNAFNTVTERLNITIGKLFGPIVVAALEVFNQLAERTAQWWEYLYANVLPKVIAAFRPLADAIVEVWNKFPADEIGAWIQFAIIKGIDGVIFGLNIIVPIVAAIVRLWGNLADNPVFKFIAEQVNRLSGYLGISNMEVRDFAQGEIQAAEEAAKLADEFSRLPEAAGEAVAKVSELEISLANSVTNLEAQSAAIDTQIARLGTVNSIVGARLDAEKALNNLQGIQLDRAYEQAQTAQQRYNIAVAIFKNQVEAARIEYQQTLASIKLEEQKIQLQLGQEIIKGKQILAEGQLQLLKAGTAEEEEKILGKLRGALDAQNGVIRATAEQIEAQRIIGQYQTQAAGAQYKAKVETAGTALQQKLVSDQIGLSNNRATALAGQMVRGATNTATMAKMGKDLENKLTQANRAVESGVKANQGAVVQFSAGAVQATKRQDEWRQSVLNGFSAQDGLKKKVEEVSKTHTEAYDKKQKDAQTAYQNIAKSNRDDFIGPVQKQTNALAENTIKAFNFVAQAMGLSFTSAFSVIKTIVRGVLITVVNAINVVSRILNSIINRANQALAAVGSGTRIGTLPILDVPEFAKGGVVNKPTLAMIGEGGEREYVVPESKAPAFASNWMSGQRGEQTLSGSAAPSQINVTTGPVVEFNGEQYVSRADFESGLQQVADAVLGRMRTPSARIALGRV
jgi:tape measure domain-containing protein